MSADNAAAWLQLIGLVSIVVGIWALWGVGAGLIALGIAALLLGNLLGKELRKQKADEARKSRETTA